MRKIKVAAMGVEHRHIFGQLNGMLNLGCECVGWWNETDNKITKDFYRDNKRVSNKKIKKILGWTPKFENYKLGLKEILNIINGKNTANNPLS